jgi:hypothetical protein
VRSWVIPGSSVAPSDAVPGGGEVLARKKRPTRLLSPLDARGPLCKRQGPACNFLFPLGLYVSGNVLILIYERSGPLRPFLC